MNIGQRPHVAYRVKNIHSLALYRKALLNLLPLTYYAVLGCTYNPSLGCWATVRFANEMQGENSDILIIESEFQK